MALSRNEKVLQGFLLVVMSIILPTYDAYNDLYFSLIAIHGGHYHWGFSLLAPVLLNMVFTFATWSKLDRGETWAEDRRWTWILVIFMVWPQWRAGLILYDIVIRSDEEALERKKEFERRVGVLEPFLEAAPQVIIKSAIIGQLLNVDWDSEEDEVVKKFGERTVFFVFSYFVSVIGAGVAMSMFMKSGPSRIVGDGWTKSTIWSLFLCFCAVFFTLLGKMLLLMYMMPGSSGWLTAELAGVWASFLLFPQFLLSLSALYRAAGCRRLFPTIAQFPAFLATPILTCITFGPHTEKGFVAFSPKFSIANTVITLVMAVALVFMSRHIYDVSYVDLAMSLGTLVGGQFFTLALALAVQFPNNKHVQDVDLDQVAILAVLNTATAESEDVETN